MKDIYTKKLQFLTFIFLMCLGSISHADITLGTFSSFKVLSPFSGDYLKIRAEIFNQNNFGANGIIGEKVVFKQIPIATKETLSDIDVFYIELLYAPLPASEITAIVDFVLSGKSLIIIADSVGDFNTRANDILTQFDDAVFGDVGLMKTDKQSMHGRLLGNGLSTQGPFGNLANKTLLATPGMPIIPGPLSKVTALARVDNGPEHPYMVEIDLTPIYPNAGPILVMADRLLFDVVIAEDPSNSSNVNFFMNFIANARNKTSPIIADFTGDRRVDAKDIDRIFKAVRNKETAPAFDLNGDGVLNRDDEDFLITNILGSFRGDANLDCIVNYADSKILSENWYKTGTSWETADFSGDGQTNAADLNWFAINYGHSNQAADGSCIKPLPQ